MLAAAQRTLPRNVPACVCFGVYDMKHTEFFPAVCLNDDDVYRAVYVLLLD